ncbi:MAG: hypothetical protein ACRDTJ_04045 [Pseudonocardiaceae bacterium]
MSIWPRRDPLPITDPGWLVSTQPDDEEPEELAGAAGLDGNGTWSAADLPASAWQPTSRPVENEDYAETEAPVRREFCLALSESVVLPMQCRDHAGHVGAHDWERDTGPLSTKARRERLLEEQDSPSGMLPVRTPGEALRDAGSDACGSGDVGESERPAESILGHRVIERWPA